MKILKVILSVLLVLVGTLAMAQPNDNVCSATPLTLDAACTTSDNTGATTQVGELSPACWLSAADLTVWFSFVAPATGAVEVTTDFAGNALSDTQLAMYSSSDNTCTGTLTTSWCSEDDGTVSVLAGVITATGLVPGNTYFVQADGYGNGASSRGSFCIQVNTLTPPGNDQCSGADAMPTDGTCVAGTTVDAADDYAGLWGCQASDGNADVWYTFVADESSVGITVTEGTMGGDVELALYTNVDCATGSRTIHGQNCGTSVLVSDFSGLVVGQTYYVFISSTGADGTFTICGETYTPTFTPGQDCPTAQLLCDVSTFNVGSVVSAAGAISGNGSEEDVSSISCFGGDERQSQWYTFTVAQSGALEFQIEPNTFLDDYDWAVWKLDANGCDLATAGNVAELCNWSGCPGMTGGTSNLGQFTGCNNATCDYYSQGTCNGDQWETGLAVTAGDTYVILIDNFSAASNDGFTFTWTGTTAVIGPQAPFTLTGGGCSSLNVTVSNTAQTPNMTYDWDWGDGNTTTGGTATDTHTYATAGAYTIGATVTDASGCVDTYILNVVAGSTLAADAGNDLTGCLGAVVRVDQTPVASGGFTTYSYQWGPNDGNIGPLTVERPNITITGTPATYTVTVTDNRGCTATSSMNVSLTSVTITASATDVVCGDPLASGSVTAPTNSVSTPYTYVWQNATPATVGTTMSVTGLVYGTYDVTMTDNVGCTDVGSVTIGGNTTDVGSYNSTITGDGAVVSQTELILCINDVADVLTNNDYLLPNAGTAPCVSGLDYAYFDCAPTTGDMTDPCYLGGISGAGDDWTRTNNGGSTAATIAWLNGQGYATTNNTFWVVPVTMDCASSAIIDEDGDGCTDLGAAVKVTYLEMITVTVPVENCDGSVTMDLEGGYPEFYAGAYTLTNTGSGTLTSTNIANHGDQVEITGLNDGDSWSFSVVDGIGCPAVISGTFTTGGGAATAAVTDPLCNGDTNGSIDLTVTGGQTAYTFVWDNGAANVEDPSGLGAGTYNVSATDADGCLVTATAVLTEPAALNASAVATSVTCNGGNNGSIDLTVSGGTTAYGFVWDNGAANVEDPGTLGANTYNVTVTDANGCSIATSAVVAEPTPVTVTINVTATSCGLDNGAVSASAGGGSGAGYTYDWEDASSGAAQTALAADAAFQVTVTDGAGCSITSSANIGVSSAVTVTATKLTDISCAGQTDGSASASATGGSGTYTYLWDGGATAALSGTTLSPGSQCVTVTDNSAAACTGIACVSVVDATAITITVAATSVTCNAAGDGAVDITVSGGAGANLFSWDNDGTGDGYSDTEDISSLGGGTYNVSVQDANGCIETAQGVVAEPSAITVTAIVNQPGCNGDAGTIDQSVVGGAGGYSYNWDNGTFLTFQDETGTAGNYNVTVTDGSGCTETAAYVLTEPSAITITGTPNAVSCNGGSDGGVTSATVGGGTAYTYSWTGGSTNANLTGVAAGQYQVTVTDNTGCTEISAMFTVTEPSAITVTTVPTAVSCNGLSDGSINTTATGGAGGFGFIWDNGAANVEDPGTLPAGTYNVTVTDANGCIVNATGTITEPSAITLTPSSVDATCGNPDGQATIGAAGGAGGFTYLWTTTATTSTITGVAAGGPWVTVTDATGCTVSAQVNVNDAGAPSVTITNVVNVLCNGNTTGSADANASGGGTAYTYAWTSGSTTTASGAIGAGLQAVTITDNLGCVATDNVVITEPNALTASSTDNQVDCNGNANGSVNLTVLGGVTNYSYAWSNAATTEDLSGLSGATPSVTITDANGCTLIYGTTISEPAALVANVTCTGTTAVGGNDGSVASSVTGGATPYNYQWSTLATTANISGLTAANYIVSVTDANGCPATDNCTVVDPNCALTLTTASTEPLCAGDNNGEIAANTVGGALPYTYSWSDAQVSATATGLVATTYNVSVSDNVGCTAVLNGIVLGEPTALSVVTTNCTDATSIGGNEGSSTVSATGGTTAYAYNWTGGQTTMTATALSAGTYNVTVSDANGCTQTGSCIVADPGCPVTLNITTTAVLCNAEATGTATAQFTSTETPYSYNWSNGNTTMISTGLSVAGAPYTVTVTDNIGCTASLATGMTEPTALVAAVTCTGTTVIGGNDGSAISAASGGTTNYSYAWSSGSAVINAPNLMQGVVTVTITDGNGCTATDNCMVNDPGCALTASTTVTDVLCNGDATGTATALAANGDGSYTYLWDAAAASQATATAGGLSQGTVYSVTATDGVGCTAITTASVNEPTVVSGSVLCTVTSAVAASDGGATASASGGVSGWTYTWSNGSTLATASGLSAGPVTVTIEDANGCATIETCTVNDPVCNTTISTTVTDALCNGSADGTATAVLAGGNAPFTYNWSNGNTNATATGLSVAGGVYGVTVTDAINCVVTSTASVSEPSAVTISTSGVDAICNGEASGSATATAGAGSGGFTYVWSNGQTNATATNLNASTVYTVTATDVNGCAITDNISVSEPTAITALFTITDATCGTSNGAATVAGNGGNGTSFSYIWSTGAAINNISSQSANTYSVTITDNLGCSAIDQAQILNAGAPVVTITSVVDPSCNGGSDGSITMSASGGATPYTWIYGGVGTVNVSTYTVTGLGAGTHGIDLLDATFCLNQFSITLTEPTAVVASVTATPTLCYGSSDGQVTADAVGGTTAYTYAWDIAGTITAGQSVAGLPAGSYQVSVTDAQGCVDITTAVVAQPADITLTETSLVPTSFGGTNGWAAVAETGGTPGFTYLWDNGATTQTATGLGTGFYSVTVTDLNGCTDTITSFVPEFACAGTPLLTITDVSCNGGSDGALQAGMLAGTAPFTYLWSSGETTQGIGGLTIGTYEVTVTDGDNCRSIQQLIDVVQPTALTITGAVNNNVSCNGLADGDAGVTVTGGTTPYAYAWTTGSTTDTQTGISAGVEVATVTDGNGCVITSSLTVTEPELLTTTATVNNNLSCNGDTNGEMTVGTIGGTTPYTYSWTNGSTTMTVTGLTGGAHTVTVTDGNGCESIATETIIEPALVVVNVANASAGCFGDQDVSLTAVTTGGTTPYNYAWSPTVGADATLTGIGAGSYSVTVTDANGCEGMATALVDEPAALVLDGVTNSTTCGTADGTVSVNVFGGSAPFGYLWSNGATSASQSNVGAGTYVVTVTDANGCEGTAIMGLLDEGGPVAEINTSLDANCNGEASGYALVTSNTGTEPFTYVWSDSQGTEAASDLVAGTYSVTMTDANGCVSSASIVINEPTAMSVSLTSTETPCGESDGTATATATGGDGNYSFNWDLAANQQTGAVASNLTQGSYTVYVTDGAGCVTSGSVSVAFYDGVVAEFTATPDGEKSPVIVDIVNNSTDAAVYAWDFGNGETSSDDSPVVTFTEDGTFEILLTAYSADSSCWDTATAVITVIGQSEISLPNVFSPNDDGVNDVFNVQQKNLKYLSGMVFNRWGEKIWAWETVQGGWDGRTLAGNLAPDGTYFVKIKAEGKDGKMYDIQGSLTLIR